MKNSTIYNILFLYYYENTFIDYETKSFQINESVVINFKHTHSMTGEMVDGRYTSWKSGENFSLRLYENKNERCFANIDISRIYFMGDPDRAIAAKKLLEIFDNSMFNKMNLEVRAPIIEQRKYHRVSRNADHMIERRALLAKKHLLTIIKENSIHNKTKNLK